MNLSFIAAPLVGSLIGYCTNFIAVKMLFFPKKEIRIKGHKVPFTPGAIPKGKPRLANAIGDIVGNTLVTKEDIEEKLLSDKVVNRLADSIMGNLASDIKTTIMDITSLSEENYLSGVHVQYESEALYHNMLKEVEDKHVIFLDTGSAYKQ